MYDWVVLLGMTVLPLILCIPLVTAIILLIKDPDPLYSTLFILVSTLALLSEDLIYESIFNAAIYNLGGLEWVFSSIIQGFLALIGVLGSFMMYNLQSLKESSRQVRREAIKNIPNFDFSKIVVDDKNFVDYLNRVWETHKRQEIRYAIYFLSVILDEKNEIEYLIKHQFVLLFTSIFLSLSLLLIMDGYYAIYTTFFKLMVYFIFSVSLAALMSTVRSVFKLTQAGKLH